MPNWITEQLGTASYYDLDADILSSDVVIVDIRELVDKEGNPDKLITDKVNLVTGAMAGGRRVLVCCDKGISRSNTIALGALLSSGISYEAAIQLFYAKGLTDMNMALLHQVKCLYTYNSFIHSKEGAILITGGSGFIGRHLVEKLSRSGHILYSPGHQGLNLAANPIELDSYINRHQIKTIIHLAHPKQRNNIASMGESIQMTKNILDTCRLNRCHLYFISSLTVYSGYTSEQPLVANSIELLPKGLYGETKYLCECLINNYKVVHKIKAAILRPSAVYGPGQDKATFMEKFLSFAVSGDKIITHEYRNGRPAFDFLYVDDFIDAIEKSLTNQFTGTLNLGTGIAHTTFQVAESIRDITNSSSQVTTQFIDDETYKIIVDPADAQSKLGWEPLVTLQVGIQRMVNAKDQK